MTEIAAFGAFAFVGLCAHVLVVFGGDIVGDDS
jgi:hypothetical protein